MVESSGFFLFERSWYENHLELVKLKNFQPFIVQVGLNSPLKKGRFITSKKCHFLEEIFFLRNKIEKKLPVGIAERWRGWNSAYRFICLVCFVSKKVLKIRQFFLFLHNVFNIFQFWLWDKKKFINFFPLEPYLKIFVRV